MKRLVLLLMLLGMPVATVAAPIRAGEHQTFSRLVVEIPVGAEWQIAKTDFGYSLIVPGSTGFNTEEVFVRIPKTRIEAVHGVDVSSSLSIFVTCSCNATAFLWQPNKVVVDINDGLTESVTPTASVEAEVDSDPRQFIVLDRPLTLPLSGQNSDLEVASTVGIDIDPNLAELSRLVTEGLARGASQGLLTPAEKLNGTNEKYSGIGPPHVGMHFERNRPGLLAHTSIDLGKLNPSGVDQNMETVCLSDDYFSIETWGEPEQFSKVIAGLRSELTNEMSEIGHVQVNQLAKGYLYFGFGREAKVVLSLDDERSQERTIIEIMGAILEGDAIDDAIMKHQLGCEGSVALWAFLSNPRPPSEGINTNAVLRAFRRLPLHLQRQLFPAMSQKLLAIGDLESASMILGAEEPNSSDMVETKLARTELKSHIEGSDAVIDSLAEMVKEDSRMTPEALIKYFELSVSGKTEISEDAIALADVFRFEFRGQEVVGRLAAAQTAALLEIPNPKRAFEVLAEEGDRILDSSALEARIIIVATEEFSDADFLNLAFSDVLEGTSPPAQNTVAQRLLAIGLAERAALLLATPARGDDMVERRYLRSEADIQLGDYDGAIRTIAGINTSKAVEMRQRAELLAQDAIGSVEAAVGNNWRMGNWAALSQGSDDLLQTTSLAVLTDSQSNEIPDEPLSFGKGLIGQSEETRQLLGSLLKRFSSPSELN